MSKVDSVILDMDGVIVDSHPVHRKAWHAFLQRLGKDVTDEELEVVFDGRKRSEILSHFLGEMPEAKLVQYGKMKDELFQGMSFEVKPVPGVIEFVESLVRKKIKLAVATSASKGRTLSTLKRLCLIDCFSTIVTGDDVLEGKSSPAIYQLVCSRLHTEVSRSVVVEDSVSAVRAAKQAGFRCIGVGSDCRKKLQAAGADRVIEDFVGFSLGSIENLHRKGSVPA